MRYIKGPDFPTGGIVTNQDDLLEIYETGVGKIKIRGKVEVEKAKGGKVNLVITEIPYTMIGANIAKFLSDVAALSEAKKTQDIVDISNQSSKEGIRIVIELRKDADVENFKNLLYKKTRLEDTFGVNMLAISDGRPEVMGLKSIIKACVDFQFEVATRKYTNLLSKEMDRKEVQEGLIKACNVIDLIIEILRGSKDRNMAKNCLVNGEVEGIKFKSKESKIMATQLMFTEKQANAILEMRLYKLIGLEIEALINEHEETMANMGWTDSGLNRTQQTAIQVSHSNRVANYNAQKQQKIDSLAQAMRSKISDLQIKKAENQQRIEEQFFNDAQSKAQNLFDNGSQTDDAKTKDWGNIANVLFDEKASSKEKYFLLEQYFLKYGFSDNEKHLLDKMNINYKNFGKPTSIQTETDGPGE